MIDTKLTVATGTATATIAIGDFLGAPTDVLALACMGSLVGLALTKPDMWAALSPSENQPYWLRLLRLLSRAIWLTVLIAGATLASAWIAVGIVPLMAASAMGERFGLEWIGQVQPRIMAGILSMAVPTVLPSAWGFIKNRWLRAKAVA